ncbi:hypothetical protein Prudu_012814, partial [Prunus dulcis]
AEKPRESGHSLHYLSTTINQNCSFSNYLKKFSAEKDKDQQHMLFLLYWLNRFVFPNRSSAVLLEYRHLAEALHNHTDVGLGPTVLAHLFKNMHTATLENPLNLSAPGAFWMIQIWCSSVASGDQKDLSLVPDRISVVREGARRRGCQNDFRKKFLSITLPRDLPHGGGKPPNYHLGAEVYHPNFCARQLGCPQHIPLKSYRSCNRASSWRDVDDLEVHKDARTDALYPSWERIPAVPLILTPGGKSRFQGLPASVNASRCFLMVGKTGSFLADGDSKTHMVQTIKDINAQIIIRSFSDNRRWAVEQTPAEAALLAEEKEKGLLLSGQYTRPGISAGSPSPPPTKLKNLKRGVKWNMLQEETAAVPVTTSGTDEELREAFEEMPIHSLPGSSTTASFADPELESLKPWIWMLNWIGWRNSALLQQGKI